MVSSPGLGLSSLLLGGSREASQQEAQVQQHGGGWAVLKLRYPPCLYLGFQVISQSRESAQWNSRSGEFLLFQHVAVKGIPTTLSAF